MICQPPAGQRTHHERDAEDGQGNWRQAERAEDVAVARGLQDGIDGFVRCNDLRRRARRAKVARERLAAERIEAASVTFRQASAQNVLAVRAQYEKLPVTEQTAVGSEPGF